MKNNPLVSVIIPLYNQKQFVGQAIESILSQSYPNIEIIVVNDGSTDNPFSILKKYKKDIILINQENKGLAAARNTGINKCSGEYIQFLDADDWLNKDKIKLQLEFSRNQNTLISYCEVVQYDDITQKKQLSYIGEVKDMFSHLYNFWYSYPLPIHSLLIKKEIFKKFGLFDEGLKACEDRCFLSRIAVAGVNFNYFPFIGGFRRIHKYNMNKNRLHIVENTIKYYKKLNDEIEDSYFLTRYSFTKQQIMDSNLTYIYLMDVVSGLKRDKLKLIKNILLSNGVRFTIIAIPEYIANKHIPFGLAYCKIKSYFNRYKVIFKKILKRSLTC